MTSSFAVAGLLPFACAPDNSLPPNVILIKIIIVKKCVCRIVRDKATQCLKAERLSEKGIPEFASHGKLRITWL